MGTQGNQILTIFLLEAGSVGFLFRTSTYTPVEDQAKFEAACHVGGILLRMRTIFTLNLLSEDQSKRPNTVIYEALPRCGICQQLYALHYTF